ncbi:MAG: Fic family protein [Fluviicola sp.]
MKTLLRNARLNKQLKVKELSALTGIDQALLSKFENGGRLPTKEQLNRLALHLGISMNELTVSWLKERILSELQYEPLAKEALQLVQEEMAGYVAARPDYSDEELEILLSEIDRLQRELNQLRAYDSYRIAQALELEYTFESNRIEGNTLTLKETDLIINEGLTISGKSMREHLEAINHQDAILYIKELLDKNTFLNQRELLLIHNLVLRGIMPNYAGKFRDVQVMIKGSGHMPPQPFLMQKQMEDYFIWYQENRKTLHPVVLAAEMHERLVTIHPFIDGNGRTSRLVMNLILLQHGYVIANIKGDSNTRLEYYTALEKAQVEGDKTIFYRFVAATEKQCLERYLSILKQ